MKDRLYDAIHVEVACAKTARMIAKAARTCMEAQPLTNERHNTHWPTRCFALALRVIELEEQLNENLSGLQRQEGVSA